MYKIKVDKAVSFLIMKASMVRRGYTAKQMKVGYWARQALELYQDIEDESFEELADSVRQAMKTMDRDRRIVVIGGACSGKSSLLGGMLESDVPKQVKMDGPCLRWRYSCQDGDPSMSRFLPVEELDGLELVDTGDCADAAIAESVRGLLDGADVLVAAIDARRLETDPCWGLLQDAEEKVGSVILAITFTDTLGSEATLSLKDTIRKLCRERLSGTPMALFVCPTSEAALEPFTVRVQEALEAPRGVRRDIHTTVQCAAALNNKVAQVLFKRNGVMITDSGFMQGIDREIDNFLSHQKAALPALVQEYEETARGVLPKALSKLRFTLGFFFSPVTLLRLELLGAGLEYYCYKALSKELMDKQQQSDERFIASCAGHWRSVRPRMKETLECEIGDFPAAALQADLDELRTRLGRELYEPFKKQRVRHKLNLIFTSRTGWMFACLQVICFMLMLAGLFGYFDQNSIGLCLMLAAVMVWAAASLAHNVATGRMIRALKDNTTAFTDCLGRTMAEVLEDKVVSRVSAYRLLYTKPRMKVAAFKEMLGPLTERNSRIKFQLSSESKL